MPARHVILLVGLISFTVGNQPAQPSNALIHEDSPYLKQHAHNPVDWLPWGDKALQKAKRANKLIFLSIGYSTCHWCHVMEKESFESEAVAALLNRDYIAIKVDKEELPQIDTLYQRLYRAIRNKRGGWPLSVILTPDLKVVHIATYIPKDPAYGSKGMLALLPHYAKQYAAHAPEFTERIARHTKVTQAATPQKPYQEQHVLELVHKALKEIAEHFDTDNGGFAKRPKFPEPAKIKLLMTLHTLTGHTDALTMAQKSLDGMARLGLYDHVEGGFFRYTTDARWHIPHFEKLLYTNAELIPRYVALHQISSNPFYKKVVAQTITHFEERFLAQGLYRSASDADSKGVEGGYFLYEHDNVEELLAKNGFTKQSAAKILAYLGIEEDGNIDGDLSHLHLATGKAPEGTERVLALLKEQRKMREFPFVDSKIITSWNAMMIAALFHASRLDPNYLALAQKRMDALLKLMYKEGKLYHQALAGKSPKRQGILEDYAFVIDALLAGYRYTYRNDYLSTAYALAQSAIAQFYRNGRWRLSNDRLDILADFDDRHYTSPLGAMLDALLRLAHLRADLKLYSIAKKSIESAPTVSAHTSPTLANLRLQLLVGHIVIKSTAAKLPEAIKNIRKTGYPYLLYKPEDISLYLGCTIDRCFVTTPSLDKLEKAIREEHKRFNF